MKIRKIAYIAAGLFCTAFIASCASTPKQGSGAKNPFTKNSTVYQNEYSQITFNADGTAVIENLTPGAIADEDGFYKAEDYSIYNKSLYTREGNDFF